MSQEDDSSSELDEGEKIEIKYDTQLLALPRHTPRSVSDPTPSTKRSDRLQAVKMLSPVTPEKIIEKDNNEKISKTIDSMSRTLETLEKQRETLATSKNTDTTFTLSSDSLVDLISNLLQHAQPESK